MTKILLIHALKLREHLERKQISKLIWVDTRDMDALNKGSISRDATKLALIRLQYKPHIFEIATAAEQQAKL